MSLASSRIAFDHRCTIQRNEGEADPWGGTGDPVWADLITDLPCKAWSGLQQGWETPNENAIVVSMKRFLAIPFDTEVDEGDRVGNVTWGDKIFFEGPMNIEAVLVFSSHKELVLEKIG